ncbi:MAG: FtsL-like putative cell division protein [Patescibacteria group bacterium]|nr:FtsL-like putative cell division protein [Patescibacteria group bacterium]
MNSYIEKKQTLREKKEALNKLLFSTSFRVSVGIFVLVFGVLYILQTTSVSTKGYMISDLERQVAKLEYENRKMDVQIAKLKSMQNLQDRIAKTDLVYVTNVDYLQVLDGAVARR